MKCKGLKLLLLVCSVSYSFILIADIDVIKNLPPKVVPGRPEVNQPFSLPCFHDVDNQLFPKDADKFTDIEYNWELSVGGNTEVYPDDVATDPTRIKVDPVTGRFEKLSLHVCELYANFNKLFLSKAQKN